MSETIQECKPSWLRVRWWHFVWFMQRYNWDNTARRIAWMLPRHVVMWAYIRVHANATTGQWGNVSPDDVNWHQCLDRWDVDETKHAEKAA